MTQKWVKVDGIVAVGILKHTQHHPTLIQDPCVYCYEPGNTVEHILPRSLGGAGVNNRAAACRRCNSFRGSMPLLLWLLLIKRRRSSVVEQKPPVKRMPQNPVGATPTVFTTL